MGFRRGDGTHFIVVTCFKRYRLGVDRHGCENRFTQSRIVAKVSTLDVYRFQTIQVVEAASAFCLHVRWPQIRIYVKSDGQRARYGM